MKTGKIKFNLKNRGRQLTGQERDYNIKALVDYINSPKTQESVKNGDMFGYYGHAQRMKYNIRPSEVGFERDGRVVNIEPAFVTRSLVAYDDGTVEHEAEFLTTESGQIAANLFKSNAGGFSAAITPNPWGLHGFDYVLSPNYTSNRGYCLDSANEMTLDSIEQAVMDEKLQALVYMLNGKEAEISRLAVALDSVTQENIELQSIIMNGRELSENKTKISTNIESSFLDSVQNFDATKLGVPEGCRPAVKVDTSNIEEQNRNSNLLRRFFS